MMKIDKNLNLVIPVERDDGAVIYVHSTPLSREVFEKYYLVIAKTLDRIHSNGLGNISGARIANLMLKEIAKELGIWDGLDGVNNGLLQEIKRLSNVLIATDAGWKTVPLYNAIASGMFSDDDIIEIENYQVFFICVSSIHKKKEIPHFLETMHRLWDTLTTSLNSTEYAASLPILTQELAISEQTKLSSVPS
jgi:hypothetical protein